MTTWLSERRPDAIITFGSHGITGHPDHVVVGSAVRWAVERLAEEGIAPNAVYVISPVFGPESNRYDLSSEEQGASHRIEITHVAARKLAALECHASQTDTADAISALRAAIDAKQPIYEGYTRVRPAVPVPHPKFDTRLW
jgi:LmbE family N-acetylglucosaminyl deacetylase